MRLSSLVAVAALLCAPAAASAFEKHPKAGVDPATWSEVGVFEDVNPSPYWQFDPAAAGRPDFSLIVTDETAFYVGGRCIERAQLGEGVPVRVSYDEDAQVTRVDVLRNIDLRRLRVPGR